MMEPVRSPSVTLDALLDNSGWVRALALSLVRDEQRADDLVQETWLRALETPPTRAETTRGWLATVLRNLVRDGWRKDSRRAARESAAARREALPATSDLVARAEAHRALIRHVTDLPEPYRTVVLLRFFEDLPPREIAARLGTPAATVRTRLHRALRLLRTSLDTSGDHRGKWALALLPLPGSLFTDTAAWGNGGASTSALTGGLVVTTQQKLAVAAALVLLLCGGAAWVASTAGGASAPDDADGPAETASVATESGRERVEPKSDDPEPAAERETAADAETEPVAAPLPPPMRRERLEYTVLRHVAPREVPKGYTELAPGEEPVIPDRGEATGIGAAGPTLLPYWSRWAPVPVKGAVTILGRVTDASGRPLEGAQVYRVELDENGQRDSPSSYQWIDEIAVTDANGNYLAREQPSGDFRITADFRATMRTRRGLDITPGQLVGIGATGTLRGVDVQLPVESARLGSVRFLVKNERGEPMRNAEIRSPMERLYTDENGRARLGGLPPGVTPVQVRQTGYAAAKIDVDLQPGDEKDIEVQLDFAEKGDLVLEGRVVDEEGRPVAKAPIFLGASFQGSRWAKTGDDGVFRFENMSRKYEQKTVKVMVSPHPERDRFKALGAPIETTVPAPGLELVVQRTAKLHVLIRDEESGEPLSLYAITTQIHAVVDGEEQWRNHHSMSHYDEAGEAVFMVPKGRFRLTVRAKDHRGFQIEVDMPDAMEDREILVAMKRE